jgi:hypothetical protein
MKSASDARETDSPPNSSNDLKKLILWMESRAEPEQGNKLVRQLPLRSLISRSAAPAMTAREFMS